jgi:uncharacterized protein YqcC (DUF446 family)
LKHAKLLAKASRLADAIEAELRKLGRWSAQRPPDEKFVDMGAFGMNTLSSEQWIQFVLVPRVREVVKDKGELPTSSSVAVWATRNFDGDPDADHLLSLLRDFDALFDDGDGGPGRREDDEPPGPSGGDPKLGRLTARLTQHLATLPTVKSAYLAQLFFPATEQLTTPILGLELDGPIAPDAFAGLPPEDPFIAMVVADDAVSRLLRLGAPFYTRQSYYIHPDYK